MFKLSCIPFFQSTSSDNIVLAMTSYRCTTRCPLCTTRFNQLNTDVFATFLIYISIFRCVLGLSFIMAFSFPKIFVVSEIRWSAERPTRTRCQAWLSFLPSRKRSHIPYQQVLCLVVSLFLVLGQLIKIIFIYIHVFLSKRVVYWFYDYFGGTTIIQHPLITMIYHASTSNAMYQFEQLPVFIVESFMFDGSPKYVRF